ncbi:MAG: glycosyl transferase [Gammaproteobacteria bacterium]|nr:glycosyl transferase [Gammaproteobacteria bacterium]
MKKIHVFTSAACNYIPKVRVLLRSIKKWHPEWVIHLALSDEIPEGIDLSDELFDEIHPASELGIPDFVGWAFCHNIVELSTAIKPFVLKKLLARDDCAGVIYLDPDMVVFSRLEEVLLALKDFNIALTPHQTSPEKSLVAIMDNEICSLKHGIYNLGFIAVSPTDIGKTFANWWAERLYYFCRDEIPNGLFTDQRWIDLAPAFFEGVHILRSSRFNVAPWNLTTRVVTGDINGEVLIDGKPLGFYHFTGFDSGAHHVMMQKNSNNNNTAIDLVNWYTGMTSELSKDPLSAVPWSFGSFSDGSKIPSYARLIYRERVDLQHKFPNPFDSAVENGGYKTWWQRRAKKEYPELFSTKKQALELMRIQKALTPGFQAGSTLGAIAISSWGHLRESLRAPGMLVKLFNKAWNIFKNEGVSGIAKRIHRLY